jgi:hypothetical protein
MAHFFKKGQILEAKDRSHNAGLHFIVFIKDDERDGDFVGVALTHSSRGNVAMESNHFVSRLPDGQQYPFQFGRTYAIPRALCKPGAWGPFKVVGCLSSSGLHFIEKQIVGQRPVTWEVFLKEQSRVG